ncbi:hypothetical protein QQF64_033854, partial [Cirrhinus molitorella]
MALGGTLFSCRAPGCCWMITALRFGRQSLQPDQVALQEYLLCWASRTLLQSQGLLVPLCSSTLYTLDLLSSFQELKVISPGFSRQAFAKLLKRCTKIGGRTGQINSDALQRSFLEFSYVSYEKDQLCCGAPFTCPACTPEMLAVSADGNRKLYRFRRETSSDDPGFFEGLFVAEDSAVSRFVDTVQKAVRNFHYSFVDIFLSSDQSDHPSQFQEAELKAELLCTDEVVSQWFSDVKEWAAGDSSKLRHHLRRKLAEDKKLLLQETEKYNSLGLDSATNIDVAVVENSLTGESTVFQIWPWEVHGSH